ncbi:MAG: DUF3999 family protein [Ramlibacter sp.]
MNHITGTRRVCAVIALALGAGVCSADDAAPARTEFAWRAPLAVPAGASLVRVDVPAQALMLLQSRDANDLRVFNAAGEPVAFAHTNSRGSTPPPAAARTAGYAALPLYGSSATGTRPAKGSMQVRINDGQQRSVWVRMDGAEVAGAPKLSSVLFATKDEKQALSGIDVQATLPANTPVRMSVSSSADLAQWAPLPVRGRLYRFEGAGAPSNMTLEFDGPVKLEGRYLRLDWSGQDGVAVTSVAGVIAPAVLAPPRARAPLPAPQAAGTNAVEMTTGFATPLAGIALSTPVANTLLPVRVLARNEPSQPWRLIGQTVVYRLGTQDSDATNPVLPLQGASARWLRVESTNGASVAAAQLQVTAEFQPMRLVFVATGAGPFELATGRVGTAAAALPWSTIGPTLGTRQVEDLPAGTPGQAVVNAVTEGDVLSRLIPGAASVGKTAVLWAVLLIGVLLLAAVAWSLLRQLKQPALPPV